MSEANMGAGSQITPPHRDYTGLAYLNDDFKGGELVFPNRDVIITPKPGLLVGFPSNHKFVRHPTASSVAFTSRSFLVKALTHPENA
jgi:hypothetical protein